MGSSRRYDILRAMMIDRRAISIAMLIAAALLISVFSGCQAPSEQPSSTQGRTRTMVVDANQASAMSPTLSEGDVVTVRIVWDGMVSVGDLVVFDDPTKGEGTSIRRVLAKGGQTVDIKGGSLIVDGERIEEGYTNGEATEASKHAASLARGRYAGCTVALSSDLYPTTVSDGCYWVMSDNRSADDSRFFGDIEGELIRGVIVSVNDQPI